MNRRSILLIAVMISLTGCAGLSDQQRTVGEGAAIGAILGVIPCALTGNKTICALSIGLGTALGAGAGALLSERKKQYASEEAMLDGEIQSAAELNQTASRYNQEVQHDIADLERSLQSVRSEQVGTQSARRGLAERYSVVQARMAQNKRMHKKLKDEYNVKVALYQEMQSKLRAEDARLVRLGQETQFLNQNIQELQDSNQQLIRMSPRLSM